MRRKGVWGAGKTKREAEWEKYFLTDGNRGWGEEHVFKVSILSVPVSKRSKRISHWSAVCAGIDGSLLAKTTLLGAYWTMVDLQVDEDRHTTWTVTYMSFRARSSDSSRKWLCSLLLQWAWLFMGRCFMSDALLTELGIWGFYKTIADC